MKLHTMATWFSSGDVNNLTPIEYFEKKFKMNKLGTFKVPASIARRFTTNEDLANFFNALGETYIAVAVKLKKILKKIPFELLEETDREEFRTFICEQIQFAVTNNQIIQVSNGSAISTSSFTFTVDTTPWALTSDQLSVSGKIILQNTEIDSYQVIEEDEFYTLDNSGNILILGRVEIKDNPNITVVELEA